ncbi:MAG: mevalonate kinase [Thaumarchaeota archaeon]|nr:mevalonate kinase [Nitrososphaerota archaeon]MDE1831902.1 mevalonate kinase [Nitrososphaerota archaeon]MDE1840627.1 mevalonate kinase [Nitrososphaerota archaeon]MDE1878385.1 mevalonate kinase [Nitrososphaerota archaeon]
MKSVASAPGKIILFGEHFVVHGTKAVLCSIDKRITATSQFVDERIVRIRSSLGEAEMDIDSLDNLENVQQKFMRPFFHIAKKTLMENPIKQGIEITIESEIPAGVGLGSSSSACVAVTASVNGLFRKLSSEEVVKIAIQAERTIFEQNSGADSSVSTFGGLVSYDLKSGFQPIPSRNDLSFIISNSAQVHNTQDVVRQVRQFKEKNEDLFNRLCKEEMDIINNAITSLRENNLNKLGFLMLKNHELLKQIGVSTEKIDLLIKEAKKTAYGAKITGAGGGGCIIALVDNSNIKDTLDNLRKISDCFIAKIDYDGLQYV